MNPNETSPRGRLLRRLLACNPFYLCSAALLLWGVYLISNDSAFLSHETSQLAFNFSALQTYEFLLVATAILLARRAVWYDSTLLVGLETGLLVAPFILVSHAALIDAGWVWSFCGVGLGLAFARGVALRQGLPRLNLPPRVLWLATGVLVVNAVLPVLYRILHENKAGTRPDFGAAYWTNEVVWLAGLPLLVGAIALLPPPRPSNDLIPGRRWLPATFLCMLLAATVVHLWSLGYVYDFAVRRELVAPATWALAWMLYLRVRDFVADPGTRLRGVLLVLPAVAALVPATRWGHWLPALLAAINLLIYGIIAWRRNHVRLAAVLAVASFACVVAAMPMPVGWGTAAMWGTTERWGGAAILLALLAATVWRSALAGLAGALAIGILLSRWLADSDLNGYWIVQAAATLLLIHSLRWAVSQSTELARARRVLAGAWALYSLVVIGCTEADWLVSLVGLGVCVAWAPAFWRGIACASLAVLLAGVTVAFGAPVMAGVRVVAQAPGGVLTLAGSLLLFAMGTLLALSRPMWQASPPVAGSPEALPTSEP